MQSGKSGLKLVASPLRSLIAMESVVRQGMFVDEGNEHARESGPHVIKLANISVTDLVTTLKAVHAIDCR